MAEFPASYVSFREGIICFSTYKGLEGFFISMANPAELIFFDGKKVAIDVFRGNMSHPQGRLKRQEDLPTCSKTCRKTYH